MYNWKITGEKFLWALDEVIVAGLLIVLTEKQECLVIIPFLEALRNYLKHRND